MPQHAKSIKIRRKDLRQPDEFETLTGRALDWASEHQVLLASAAAATVVIAAAAFAFGQWRAGQASRAAVDFDAAYHSFETGKYPEAGQSFALVAETYPRTPGGRLARLYRAHALLRQGQAAAAAGVYAEFVAAGPPTAYLRQEALDGLGHAQENAGDAAAALDAYTQAAALDGPFKVDARLGAARLHESAGRVADARAIYVQLLGDAPAAEVRAFLETKVPAAERPPATDAAAKAPTGDVR